MASEAQSGESSQLKLVGKLLGYSLVSTTLGKGRALYERGKATNSYVARTLDLVEQSVSVAVTAASPYVNKYDAQIRKLDAAACEKLEVIEKQVPEWKAKMNADEARQLSKRVLESGRNSAYEVYDAKLKPRVDSARQTVDAKYANLLGTLDTYVDYWLPDADLKADKGANGDVNGVEPTERSVRTLTGKVTTRVGRLATRQLGAMRSRSLESLERARATGQYVAGSARATYDDFVRAVRVELDSEKSRTETSSGEHEQAESHSNPSPSYGELQRRLHDSVLLGRAFTKVGTRYTVSMLNNATHHPYYNSLTSLASNATKLLPVNIPQIRVAVRVEEPTLANSQPKSASTSNSSDNHEHADMHRQPTSETPSPGQTSAEFCQLVLS